MFMFPLEEPVVVLEPVIDPPVVVEPLVIMEPPVVMEPPPFMLPVVVELPVALPMPPAWITTKDVEVYVKPAGAMPPRQKLLRQSLPQQTRSRLQEVAAGRLKKLQQTRG